MQTTTTKESKESKESKEEKKTREKSFLKNVESDEIFLENVERRYSMDETTIFKKLTEFDFEQKALRKTHTSQSDYQNHFFYWLKPQNTGDLAGRKVNGNRVRDLERETMDWYKQNP